MAAPEVLESWGSGELGGDSGEDRSAPLFNGLCSALAETLWNAPWPDWLGKLPGEAPLALPRLFRVCRLLHCPGRCRELNII